MDQRKLTFLITHLVLRLRDYPPEALDELLRALDAIERGYGLDDMLSSRERDAAREIQQDFARSDEAAPVHTGLSKAQRDGINKRHFEIAVERVRLRPADEQGDISDLLFAILDEYFVEFPGSTRSLRRYISP